MLGLSFDIPKFLGLFIPNIVRNPDNDILLMLGYGTTSYIVRIVLWLLIPKFLGLLIPNAPGSMGYGTTNNF